MTSNSITTAKQEHLFQWVNQFYQISNLNELENISILVLFLKKLFSLIAIHEYNDIHQLLSQITFNTSIPYNSQSILSFIQSQYSFYILHYHILTNPDLSFTTYVLQFIPSHQFNLLQNNLILWVNFILSDYLNASFISPIHDLLLSTWKSGHHLLYLLHYHLPFNLNQYDLTGNVLNTFIELLPFPIQSTSLLLSDTDNDTIMVQFLLDLIPFLKSPNNEQIIQRLKYLSKDSATPSLSSTIEDEEEEIEATLTLTLQHLKITKTTRYTDLEEFESRASDLVDKISHLQHRLESIIPTRYSPTTTSSDTSTMLDSTIVEDEQPWIRILHPLQATEEDHACFDKNFKQLCLEFQTLSDVDLPTFWTSLEECKSNSNVAWKKNQIDQLYSNLSNEIYQTESCLSKFKKGFQFAKICACIRQELDAIQNKMVKSISTHDDIQNLEALIEKTTHMVQTLEFDKEDLVYSNKFDSIYTKNQLVSSWVQEIRIWFSEAERIRSWIEIRIDQLNQIIIPDVFTSLVTRAEVDHLNQVLTSTEKEIETFDKDDMARLRSHVKTLTGSDRNKDLSPADTTTIEITLTTLMTLDKLMHSLRKKGYDLQVLTQRVTWEEEYLTSMTWLEQTNLEIDAFLKSDARWKPSEQESKELDPVTKRKRLLAREKQKECVIQQLLTLERKMADFDSGQFTTTVDSFQDLDNTSSIELPPCLESKQEHLEQFFENLMKRMTFSRQVVEQRLNIMDFLHQAEIVIEDALILQMDLVDAELNFHPGDHDRDVTIRVQNMHEIIVQLVTTNRIPYPIPALDIDKEENEKYNQEISQLSASKRNELIALSEDLDDRLNTYRNVLQLHRRAKEYLNSAIELTDWADERVKQIRRTKMNVQDEVSGYTIDDLPRLQQDYNHVINKLKDGGKESKVIDLLTRIQLLLETTQRLKINSIDKESLSDISDQLQERFDRLQQILEEHNLQLVALEKKFKEGQMYVEQAQSLRSFISERRHSLPTLKQTCGFITGISREQDSTRIQMLNQSLSELQNEYTSQQAQFSEICKQFQLMQSSKTENLDEIQTIQAKLETDWTQLQTEIQDFQHFSGDVGQWYHRQRRLSMVQHEFLDDIDKGMSYLSESGKIDTELSVILQQKMNQALELLKDIGEGISNDNKEDPLHIANYSCAHDRYTVLTNKVQAALDRLTSLKSDAMKAEASAAFLDTVEALRNKINEQKNSIDDRILTMGKRSEFASEPMETIDSYFKHIQTINTDSEIEYQQLIKDVKQVLEQRDTLSNVGESIDWLKADMNQLFDTIQLEKKQAIFIKKVYIHAKAAMDLQTWIHHCSNAIQQFESDNRELDIVEERMNEMKPTIQAFEAMGPRIFTVQQSMPIDLVELKFSESEKIKSAVKQRETDILSKWNDLKHQHSTTRQSFQSKKQDDENLQKITQVLTKIDDFKHRANAIRICKKKLSLLLEHRDIDAVLNFPLASNEYQLASAKDELSTLSHDIEFYLQSNQPLTNNIQAAPAIRELMDLLKSKRRSIVEAEKIQAFLTVMEELEVLLLALNEVLSRASTENAQKSHADLRALLIDLDTRYQYYEPKIIALIEEAKELTVDLKNDVTDCYSHLCNKWQKLRKQVSAKQIYLMDRIGPVDSPETYNEGILEKKAAAAAAAAAAMNKKKLVFLNEPPTPKPMKSTPRPRNTTTPIPFAFSTTRTRQKRGSVDGITTATERRVSARQSAAQEQRQKVHKVAEYIADPKNDLDVALGNILNDSPYKIKVKMVPGEVGKYWFGEVNPKLAYCRILRSCMVMVRVGGGWVELSQFLKDHALLEGSFVNSRRNSRASFPPASPSSSSVQDGFLNTLLGRHSLGSIKDEAEDEAVEYSSSGSIPHRIVSPVPHSHGIKSGNKFLISVDNDGNHVEVKMTKAKSKTTKFITPRRNL